MFVALGIQHAACIAILSPLASSALQYFSTLFHIKARSSKNTQISNFIEIRPVGAELFHADRRTDMTNVRNFVDAH